MAICAYVLLTAFGTTDVTLLMDRGVRLPVVDVDVPIGVFAVLAPLIVVLGHFNLLLQLQLLSRKLFAFDAAAAQDETVGVARDRLSSFPFTYYLVGRPGPVMQPLLALMVSITLVLLPCVTLFALQVRFLAYQNEAITWAQRGAIWLDVAALTTLWPILLHPRGDWCAYWRGVATAYFPPPVAPGTYLGVLMGWAPYLAVLVGLAVLMFGEDREFIVGFGLFLIGALIAVSRRWGQATLNVLPVSLVSTGLLVAGIVGALCMFFAPNEPLWFAGFGLAALGFGLFVNRPRWLQRVITVDLAIAVNIAAVLVVLITVIVGSPTSFYLGLLGVLVALFWHPTAPRGSAALMLVLCLGSLLPLALLVDGEHLEQVLVQVQASSEQTTEFALIVLPEIRRLHVSNQVLLAEPVGPEVADLIRSRGWPDALKQTVPVKLDRRSLRHADLRNVILVRAGLSGAQLQGADLSGARLQGADLRGAHLQGADLAGAQLQGAVFMCARSGTKGCGQAQDLDLAVCEAQISVPGCEYLEDVNLDPAQLQGADLRGAQLQGAELAFVTLDGADLSHAELSGADLSYAKLRSVDLSHAQLQGADLSHANLPAAVLRGANLSAVRFESASGELIDARGINWAPLSTQDKDTFIRQLRATETDENRDSVEDAVGRLERASRWGSSVVTPPQPCFSDSPMVRCHYQVSPGASSVPFDKQLYADIRNVACDSLDNARGIVLQAEVAKADGDSLRDDPLNYMFGWEGQCKGVEALRSRDREMLFYVSSSP